LYILVTRFGGTLVRHLARCEPSNNDNANGGTRYEKTRLIQQIQTGAV